MRSAADWMRSPATLLWRRGDTRACSGWRRESSWPAGRPAIDGLAGFGRSEGRPRGGSARGPQASSGGSRFSRADSCGRCWWRGGGWCCLGPGLLHRGRHRRPRGTWRPGRRRFQNRPASGLRNDLRFPAHTQGRPQNRSSSRVKARRRFPWHRPLGTGRWLKRGSCGVSRHGFCFRRNRFRRRNGRFAFGGSVLRRLGRRRRLGGLLCFQCAEVYSDLRRQLFFNRAGVGFLILDADFGQVLQDHLGFYFEFPRQFVNAHRS